MTQAAQPTLTTTIPEEDQSAFDKKLIKEFGICQRDPGWPEDPTTGKPANPQLVRLKGLLSGKTLVEARIKCAMGGGYHDAPESDYYKNGKNRDGGMYRTCAKCRERSRNRMAALHERRRKTAPDGSPIATRVWFEAGSSLGRAYHTGHFNYRGEDRPKIEAFFQELASQSDDPNEKSTEASSNTNSAFARGTED